MDTTKPFKSERAARIAFGKAERAWKAAQSARIAVQHAQRDAETSVPPTADETARLDALEAEYKAIPAPARYESAAWNAHLDLWSEIRDRPEREARAVEDARYDEMRAIYNAAKAQGFFIASYELNYNPTRDLILANVD